MLALLDASDVFHQPRGRVEHSLRRVRQLRLVLLEFVAPLLPLSGSHATDYLPGIFFGIW